MNSLFDRELTFDDLGLSSRNKSNTPLPIPSPFPGWRAVISATPAELKFPVFTPSVTHSDSPDWTIQNKNSNNAIPISKEKMDINSSLNRKVHHEVDKGNNIDLDILTKPVFVSSINSPYKSNKLPYEIQDQQTLQSKQENINFNDKLKKYEYE
jgi:hypothetical protein